MDFCCWIILPLLWMNLFHFTCSQWWRSVWLKIASSSWVSGVDLLSCCYQSKEWSLYDISGNATSRALWHSNHWPAHVIPTLFWVLSLRCHRNGMLKNNDMREVMKVIQTWENHSRLIWYGLMTYVHFKEVTQVYQQALDVKKKGFLRELESKDSSVPTVNKNNEQMFVQKHFMHRLWCAAILHSHREF